MRKRINRKKFDPFSRNFETPKYNKLKDSSHKFEWTEGSYTPGQEGKDTMRFTFDLSYIRMIGAFLVLALLFLLGRAGWLQLVQGDHYDLLAQGNRIRIQSIDPARGIIYDRHGRELVYNTANFMLYLVPGDLPSDPEEKDRILDRISEMTGSSEGELPGEADREELKDKLKEAESDPISAYQPLFVADNIEYEDAINLYLETRNMPGVVLSNKNRRHYLNRIDLSQVFASSTVQELEEEEVIPSPEDEFKVKSLSHILGYTGKINKEELEKSVDYSPIDYIGKSGLEDAWEKELKGVKGKKQVEVDALGKEKRVISREESVDGNNLILSLDFLLQTRIEAILKKHLADKDTDKAAVVAMKPDTGEVLSLVSTPGYDNNIFTQGFSSEIYKEVANNLDNSLYNRAVSGEYPSGSTIKPLIAAAALEEGVVSANTTVNSTGGIKMGEWFFPDWRAGGHGVTDVRKAIAQSVNTFFYYIGGGYKDFSGLGFEKIIEYDRKFGLGDKTGIDLPSEANGFLPSREWKKEAMDESWYIGDTYHLSIGQGFLLVTPIQVANFTSVFANGGTLYSPFLVKEVRDNDSEEVVRTIEPEILNRDFIDDYALQVVREGMRKTVTSGSGRNLSTLDVTSAGKTGTAQWSSQEEDHAWFTCFAPYEDPEIVLTVLVEKGGGGDKTAVPIAKEILEYYFDNEE